MTCRDRAYSCVQVKPLVSGRTGTQSVCNVCGTDLRKKLYSVRSLYTFILRVARWESPALFYKK